MNEERIRPEELAQTVTPGDAVDRDYIEAQEAERYVGATDSEFDALVKEYGIGRYHLPNRGDQVFYAREDLAEIKEARAGRSREGI